MAVAHHPSKMARPAMIFAARPPRANMDKFETTIAIAAAATVKNNFADLFMTKPHQD